MEEEIIFFPPGREDCCSCCKACYEAALEKEMLLTEYQEFALGMEKVIEELESLNLFQKEIIIRKKLQ